MGSGHAVYDGSCTKQYVFTGVAIDATNVNTLSTILDKRRRHPIEKQDLVNVMLNNTDTKTGEKMSDESIINNVSYYLHSCLFIGG